MFTSVKLIAVAQLNGSKKSLGAKECGLDFRLQHFGTLAFNDIQVF